MSNRIIPDYAINWITQLVTVDEMNILTNQLLNDSAYPTDALVPLIYNGGQITQTNTTTISLTDGTFRLPDISTSWPAPYNTTVANFKCPSVLITTTIDDTYYIVARLSTNSTDPNLLIYTGQYFVSPTYFPATDVILGNVIIAGGVITSITYDAFRANDLTSSLVPTTNAFLTTTNTITNGYNFIYKLTGAATTTLPNLASIPGGLYNRAKYNFINNTTHAPVIVPNGSQSGSTILGVSSYTLPQNSTVSMSYDHISNSWYFN